MTVSSFWYSVQYRLLYTVTNLPVCCWAHQEGSCVDSSHPSCGSSHPLSDRTRHSNLPMPLIVRQWKIMTRLYQLSLFQVPGQWKESTQSGIKESSPYMLYWDNRFHNHRSHKEWLYNSQSRTSINTTPRYRPSQTIIKPSSKLI